MLVCHLTARNKLVLYAQCTGLDLFCCRSRAPMAKLCEASGCKVCHCGLQRRNVSNHGPRRTNDAETQ